MIRGDDARGEGEVNGIGGVKSVGRLASSGCELKMASLQLNQYTHFTLQVLVTEGSITREVSRRRVRGKDLSASQGSTQITNYLNCISTAVLWLFFVVDVCLSLSVHISLQQ